MLTVPGYNLLHQLYKSRNSYVYRAERTADGRAVIFKQLNDPYPSPEKTARFQREYEIMRTLQTPSVVEVHALEKDHNGLIMVLEDFGGHSLEMLKRNNPNLFRGVEQIDDFLRFAIQVSSALGEIHQHNVIHKDINPANIVLNPQTGVVKLIDFGLATVLSRESQTFRHPNVLEGTLAYMSPEQTGRMNRAVDYRTDLYSLGATFYELLTGQRPFSGSDSLAMVHAHIARPPSPPLQIDPHIPQVLNDIVLKLLAKNAEDRYQSAYGLKHDLELCLQQWQKHGQIASFPLGEHDISGRFQLPQKLYGRELEIALLQGAFDRVTRGGNEISLVSGQAGVGKSALVQEMYKPITRDNGYFISGKFDQFQRDNPYTSLIQAFHELIRQLLTESEEQIDMWRRKLLEALGNNGRIIIDVIAEVELIIGPQPPVIELAPTEAQNRFRLTLQNFIRLFAQADHPLTIFLDDLQWADTPSLKLMQQLMVDVQTPHLFIMGAYRDNEVNAAHPLIQTIKNMQEGGANLQEIRLQPLQLLHVQQFTAAALQSKPETISPLAELVMSKTGGMPFFVGEFLKSLYVEGLLTFDLQNGRWEWDIGRIQQMSITDNVIDLLAINIKKLNEETQQILRLAACIGNQFDLHTLALVAQHSNAQTAVLLWPAITEGLVLPLSDAYKLVALAVDGVADTVQVYYTFAHDRVQQAIYSLIPEAEKQLRHLEIGRIFMRKYSAAEQGSKLFAIVNQFNKGLNLIAHTDEKQELVRLNLLAAKKAKASAAYEPAYVYSRKALALAEGLNLWRHNYALALDLQTQAIETAYLTADFVEMARLADMAFVHSQTALDVAPIYVVLIQAALAQNNPAAAVQVCLEGLALLGVKFPSNPTVPHVLWGLVRTKLLLAGKTVEDLTSLPMMEDPLKLAVMELIINVGAAAYVATPQLFALMVFKMIDFSVNYGNTPAAAQAYATYAVILTGTVGDIDGGYRYSQLALTLLEQFKAENMRAKVLLTLYGFVRHWKEPYKQTLAPLLEAYRAGLDSGDVSFAAYAITTYTLSAVVSGLPLTQIQEEAQRALVVLRQFGQQSTIDYIVLRMQMTANLRGHAADDPCLLTGEFFDEAKGLKLFLETDNLLGIVNIYVNKMLAFYYFHRYEEGAAMAEALREYAHAGRGTAQIPLINVFGSLTLLALYPNRDAAAQRQILKDVAANQKRLKKWATHAPENMRGKYYWVEAERLRAIGQEAHARERYDEALKLIRQHGHLNDEGPLNERIASFYFGRGQVELGNLYLRQALHAYQLWGATEVGAHLAAVYPQLDVEPHDSKDLPSEATMMGTVSRTQQGSNRLDWLSIMRVSQAVSSEIRLDKLLKTMMRTVIENAGAERGCLVWLENNEWVIEAEGVLSDENVTVLQGRPLADGKVPTTVINYVSRTQQLVVLNDAVHVGHFRHDPYIVQRQPQSVLCMPLLNRGQLSAILYLENSLTTDAFTTDRQEVLNLLSTQAAVALDNARLYDSLEQRVAERTAELRDEVYEREQLIAELDAFSHTVAHDLKSPLNAVLGYAEMMQEDLRDLIDDEQREMLLNIIRGGQRMGRIVDGLLALAMARREEITMIPLDMGVIVQDVVERLVLLLKSSNAEVIVPQNWPRVVGYAPWIEEVWANYVSNAIKYGGQPPVIEFGYDQLAGNVVRFWVRDNGRGLTPEQQQKVFTPFTRLNQIKVEGHGLGLSIVQRVVERLGGEVGLESKVGQGSLFYFTLKGISTLNKVNNLTAEMKR